MLTIVVSYNTTNEKVSHLTTIHPSCCVRDFFLKTFVSATIFKFPQLNQQNANFVEVKKSLFHMWWNYLWNFCTLSEKPIQAWTKCLTIKTYSIDVNNEISIKKIATIPITLCGSHHKTWHPNITIVHIEDGKSLLRI
jgi:hypothetical protein